MTEKKGPKYAPVPNDDELTYEGLMEGICPHGGSSPKSCMACWDENAE